MYSNAHTVILTVYNSCGNDVKTSVFEAFTECYPHQCPESDRSERITLSFRVLMWITGIFTEVRLFIKKYFSP